MTDPKIHARHALLYEFQLGNSAADAHRNLQRALGEHTPAVSTCRNWYQRFADGNYDLEDHRGQHASSGQPQSTEFNGPIGQPGPRKFDLEELRKLVQKYPDWTTHDLANELDCAPKTVIRWLNEIDPNHAHKVDSVHASGSGAKMNDSPMEQQSGYHNSPIGQPGPRKFGLDDLRRLIQEYPDYTAHELADELDCAPKTVLRWLNEINPEHAHKVDSVHVHGGANMPEPMMT